MFFSLCKPNKTRNEIKEKLVQKKTDTIYKKGELKKTGTINIEINGDRWYSKMFFKEDTTIYNSSQHPICYDRDGMQVSVSTNKQLTDIFSNEIFPITIQIAKNDSVNIIDLTKQWVSIDYDDGGQIILQDVNFDGYKDIMLRNDVSSGATNRYYDIWIYKSHEKKYILWHHSLELGLWGINKKKKQLHFGYRLNAVENTMETWQMKQKDTLAILIIKETGYLKNKSEPYVKREELIRAKWKVVYDSLGMEQYFEWLKKNRGF